MDNVRDKQERGRQPRSSTHYATRLSDQDIIDIRNAHAEGVWQSELARKYGVDPSHVSDIINNRRRVIY